VRASRTTCWPRRSLDWTDREDSSFRSLLRLSYLYGGGLCYPSESSFPLPLWRICTIELVHPVHANGGSAWQRFRWCVVQLARGEVTHLCSKSQRGLPSQRFPFLFRFTQECRLQPRRQATNRAQSAQTRRVSTRAGGHLPAPSSLLPVLAESEVRIPSFLWNTRSRRCAHRSARACATSRVMLLRE